MAGKAINFSNIINFESYAEDEVVQWAVQRMKSSGIYGYVSIFPKYLYKAAVGEFYDNSKIKSPKLITSFIQKGKVEISEDTIRQAFGLPKAAKMVDVTEAELNYQEIWSKLKKTEAAAEFNPNCMRNDLNEGGKLLMDILQEIVMAHTDDPDQMSSHKWTILGAMLNKEPVDWGAFIFYILFENVRTSTWNSSKENLLYDDLMMGTQLSHLFEQKNWVASDAEKTEILDNKIWGRTSAEVHSASTQRRSKRARLSPEMATAMDGTSRADIFKTAKIQGEPAMLSSQNMPAEEMPCYNPKQTMDPTSLLKLLLTWLEIRLLKATELKTFIEEHGWNELIRMEEEFSKFPGLEEIKFLETALDINVMKKILEEQAEAASSHHTKNKGESAKGISEKGPQPSLFKLIRKILEEQLEAESGDHNRDKDEPHQPDEIQRTEGQPRLAEETAEKAATKGEHAPRMNMSNKEIKNLVHEEMNELIIPRIADLEKRVDCLKAVEGTNTMMLNKVEKSVKRQAKVSKTLEISITEQEKSTGFRFDEIKTDLKELRNKMDSLPAQLINSVRTTLLNVSSQGLSKGSIYHFNTS